MTNAVRQSEQSPIRRACILHAEDDRLTSVAIARLLTIKGYKVESAADGLDALTELLAHPASYDLIITDQAMPLLTGEEWLKGIRESGFSGKIIVYAASLPESVADHLRELGVERIVHKSESLQSLLDAIHELLGDA
ncbi:MAG: response regulator [Verrucomicrobiota bacterium]|jgi:DNA-binding response OmpR family regulator